MTGVKLAIQSLPMYHAMGGVTSFLGVRFAHCIVSHITNELSAGHRRRHAYSLQAGVPGSRSHTGQSPEGGGRHRESAHVLCTEFHRGRWHELWWWELCGVLRAADLGEEPRSSPHAQEIGRTGMSSLLAARSLILSGCSCSEERRYRRRWETNCLQRASVSSHFTDGKSSTVHMTCTIYALTQR